MSYSAIAVELREGHVIARGPEQLPANGEGLLVILSRGGEVAEKDGRNGWSSTLETIRKRQVARGHSPRSVAAVMEQLKQERESWE